MDNSTKHFIFVFNTIFYVSPFKIIIPMQNRLEDKLSMYEKVDTFLQTNANVLNSVVPILTTEYLNFKIKLDDILTTVQAAAVDTTGYTEDKAKKRQELEQLTTKITRALTAYASISKNLSLRAKINYNKSDFGKMRDNDLYANTKVVEDYANQYATDLLQYGISQADIIDLGKKITHFFDVIQTPKTKIEIRSSYLQQLEMQIQEQDLQLKNIIDPLLGILEYDEPLLFAQYKKSRSIDQTGAQSSAKTFTGNVNANSSTTVTTLSYDINRTFTFKNTGTTTLFFGLSNDGITIGGVEIEVGAGDQLTRDSSDMNSNGDMLLVRNADNIVGAYTVDTDM